MGYISISMEKNGCTYKNILSVKHRILYHKRWMLITENLNSYFV